MVERRIAGEGGMTTPEQPGDMGNAERLPGGVSEAISAWVYHSDVAWWFERAAGELIDSLAQGGTVFFPTENAVRDQAPAEACGRVGVGYGGDSWDPVCDLDTGHQGPCNFSGEPTQGQQ